MKYMVISDIHGNINKLNTVLDIYLKENCSKLLILGDLFNYTMDFNRDDIINRLNMMKDVIVAVSGNCDQNINGISFPMPIIAELELNNKKVLITHGHAFTKDYLSKSDADIIFSGHSHMSSIDLINNKLFLNPGSISKSRRGEDSFIIVDGNNITIRNLDNTIIDYYNI